ncbi:putative serine/threonine-protein kinase [Dendrobium catenatum]|uniref:[RNA-polymerase]-subunit kinase n=1 Tax=Dendrobium catenatum TaxID=906689 RepID=A0A2I0WAR9_9ASPA|nr:putative serine/threonine-protein kinase [Dendrobium catenatum]
MGCVCAKPVPIEDSRESPKARQVAQSVAPAQGIAPAKLSASAAVSSSRRDELMAFRLTSASIAERKQGSRPVSLIDRDAEMRTERQVHPNHQQLRLIGSIAKAGEGDQVAAGWPAWLVAVAGEAIRGWVPRRADSFEKLDKSGLFMILGGYSITHNSNVCICLSCFGEEGQGTYSSVYRARDLGNGKIVALKKVRFDSLEPESVRFMAREIHILRRLDHPNIIKLEGLVTSRMSCSLYLVFEYMEHDLAGLASYPGIKFTEPQVKCYMHQLLCGLDHCHTHGVLHRDIKGSNLLIDNNGILKIADFGLASFFDPEQQQPLTSRVVTLWYRPPELLLGATTYDVAVDLWSTGCILAELYAGKPIMPGRTEFCWFPAGSLLSLLSSRFLYGLLNFSAVDFNYPLKTPSQGLQCPSLMMQLMFIRQGASGGKLQRLDLERGGLRESRAVPAPDANAELSVSVKKWKNQGNSISRSEKFNPHQEEVASGFPIEPPRPTRNLEATELSHGHYSQKSSHSGPLVNRGQWATARKNDDAALKLSSAANLSSLSGLVAARRNAFLDASERNSSQLENTGASGRLSESGNERLERRYDQLYHGVSQRKEDESDSYMNQSLHPGFGPKGNKIHYSGPLPRPSGNVDQMLKDHDRQIQEVVRRARIDRSKARKNQGEGNLAGPSIKPYNLGVIPVYPSSRSSVMVFTSSRGSIQQ